MNANIMMLKYSGWERDSINPELPYRHTSLLLVNEIHEKPLFYNPLKLTVFWYHRLSEHSKSVHHHKPLTPV